MENAQDIRKIVGPEGCGDHVSFGGEVFEANKDGVFEVPANAAAELAAHGFQPAPAPIQKAQVGQQQPNGQRK